MPRWTSLLVLAALALVGAAETAWAAVPAVPAVEAATADHPGAHEAADAEEEADWRGAAPPVGPALAGDAVAGLGVQDDQPDPPLRRPPRA